MKINKEGGSFVIPQAVIGGSGKAQLLLYKCYSCGDLFIDNGESNSDKVLCEKCIEKDGIINIESSTIPMTKIIGFQQRVSCGAKRSVYNFKKVARRDNFTCQYCGYSPRLYVEFMPLHCDHIIPHSAGGSNSMDNLVMACEWCNVHLSNKIFKDFLAKKIYITDIRKEKGLPATEKQWEAHSIKIHGGIYDA